MAISLRLPSVRKLLYNLECRINLNRVIMCNQFPSSADVNFHYNPNNRSGTRSSSFKDNRFEIKSLHLLIATNRRKGFKKKLTHKVTMSRDKYSFCIVIVPFHSAQVNNTSPTTCQMFARIY